MMRPGLWRNPRLWIGVFLSLLCAWLASRGVDLSGLLRALKDANLLVIPVVIGLVVGLTWVRARRWRLLLRKVKEVRTALLFRAISIGFMTNYMVPIRLGELVRAYLVGTREEFSRTSAFATVVVERVLDIFSSMLIAMGVFLFVLAPDRAAYPHIFQSAAAASLALAVFGVALIWMVKYRTTWMTAWVRALVGRSSPQLARDLSDLVAAFAEGVGTAGGIPDLVRIAIYTIVWWVGTVLGIALLGRGFNLGLPWEAYWVVVLALAFGFSVPSAPGFVGTFHYFVMVGLFLFDVPPSLALSYAVVLHAVNILPFFVLGPIFAWWEGLTLGSLTRRQDALVDLEGK
jgi:uncharacterized protein (TIRG00374 family)